MTPFNNTIVSTIQRDYDKPRVGQRLPDVACDAIRDNFNINDSRGRCANHHWVLHQFMAHFVTDSVTLSDGTLMNRYDFDAHGRNGLYPRRGSDATIISDDGYFRKYGQGLPRMKDNNGEGPELTGDLARANENPNLRAMHNLAADFHNKQRDLDYPYEACVVRSGYVWNNVFLASMAEILKMDPMEILDYADIYPDFNREIVWHMQLNRFGHLLVPNSIGDRPLFQKGVYSNEVDLKELTTTRGGLIGYRISNEMADGAMGGKGPSILDLTISKRHNAHNCPTWGDVCEAVLGETVSDARYDWPAFAGLADETTDDGFGPLGRQLLAVGFSQSLTYGMDKDEGIYHNCDGLPTTFEELLDYMG